MFKLKRRRKTLELSYFTAKPKVIVSFTLLKIHALDCLPVKERFLYKIFSTKDYISPSSLLSRGPPTQNKFRNCFAKILMSTIIASFVLY